ncbi:LLM class flavin-dependent oxidoreductase [Aquabacter spiritensis]|uniref:Alkanesulfonate monooxygenase SsuD/methylene tetrahydromethanopterin reductase-like flavin-dependent oxidoreductase (Luciferase family) n=1 Tax=Aquabacter spiritensis TaxID=933073 RepID=A0A4R3MA90_9HYPH|nr:LLM class flavin-dependent oxidoreductase [Aquabacter spiritensis]TCT08325.1 alkanesulfonate monooxygenase SsuD/methylene tetrahydromethanopterin reductase-like flavin-dependent oxidoreductase (luciferase family) [Aquabacter spiritensis]
MKIGYFTMPVHPIERDWSETLREDREAVILADRLGFNDAFIGEHLSDRCETITNSMMFLASLVSDTKTIKLATGTSNLSQTHPTLIAAQAAMLDHLAGGRFILGISPGALTTDAEALGILDEDRNKIFAEAIDVILEIWQREAPYDIDLPGNRFKVSTRRSQALELGVGYLPKPLQKPYPEIVGTVLSPYSPGVIAMGRRDFHPLSANFLLSKWIKTHWDNYVEGKTQVGAKANPADWRVARTLFVADDEATAAAYARTDPRGPYLHYYGQILKKLKRSKRLFVMKEERDQPDEAVTLDSIMDKLVLYGTVNKVVDQILALREEAGDFGEIVYAGMDWVSPDLAKRSMQLMAEEVMPRVNAAIGSAAAA